MTAAANPRQHKRTVLELARAFAKDAHRVFLNRRRAATLACVLFGLRRSQWLAICPPPMPCDSLQLTREQMAAEMAKRPHAKGEIVELLDTVYPKAVA